MEGFLIPRTFKVLRKRVFGINATDRMLRMVARLLLVAEIEQLECNLLSAVILQIYKGKHKRIQKITKI